MLHKIQKTFKKENFKYYQKQLIKNLDKMEQYHYKFEIYYNGQKWEILKSYQDFLDLSKQAEKFLKKQKVKVAKMLRLSKEKNVLKKKENVNHMKLINFLHKVLKYDWLRNEYCLLH